MEDLTFENAIWSWGIFWISYWISGIYLSYKAHVAKLRIVTDLYKIINCLLLNMIWTFIGTVTIFYLPLKLTVNPNIIIKIILINLITELWFYHAHIMVHQGQLYKRIHKRHHEFTKPYALTALYCSGYEAVFCNLFAVGIGPVILNLNSYVLYFWFALVAINSTFSHSGFRLGWLMDGSHDIHHIQFKYNYGTLGLFDWIYGTYPNSSSN